MPAEMGVLFEDEDFRSVLSNNYILARAWRPAENSRELRVKPQYVKAVKA